MSSSIALRVSIEANAMPLDTKGGNMRRWKANQPDSTTGEFYTMKVEAYIMAGRAYEIPYTPGTKSCSCPKNLVLQVSCRGEARVVYFILERHYNVIRYL